MTRRLLFVMLVVSLATVVLPAAQSAARGTAVLLREPEDRLTVSTVLGLPEDQVAVIDGQVVVNGQPTGVRLDGVRTWGPTRIDAGTYFVGGDPAKLQNSPSAWGLIYRDRIVGIVQIGRLPQD